MHSGADCIYIYILCAYIFYGQLVGEPLALKVFSYASNYDLARLGRLNPLLPNGTICSRIVKISFLKYEGLLEKISY